MASYPSTLAYTYDIQTPVDAQYGPPRPPKLVHTSDSLVVAPTSPSLTIGHTEKETLAFCGTAQSDGFLRAASVLIGRLVDRIAVA